jgi:hypothetical protein
MADVGGAGAYSAFCLNPHALDPSHHPHPHQDPDHDPVEGMLGMEMLSLFDVDFDWPAGRLRLFKPGEGAAVAEEAGLVPIPAAGAAAAGPLGGTENGSRGALGCASVPCAWCSDLPTLC